MEAPASPDAKAQPTKSRSLSSSRKPATVSLSPPTRRRSTGNVSGTPNRPAASRTRPNAASTPKMPRQSITRLSWPPSTGAITGARPEMRISREKKINNSRPE